MKNNKFVSGMIVGLSTGFMLAFLQPLTAADQGATQAELLKEVQAIRKYTLDMAKQSRTIAADVAVIKAQSEKTADGVSKLNERSQFTK